MLTATFCEITPKFCHIVHTLDRCKPDKTEILSTEKFNLADLSDNFRFFVGQKKDDKEQLGK